MPEEKNTKNEAPKEPVESPPVPLSETSSAEKTKFRIRKKYLFIGIGLFLFAAALIAFQINKNRTEKGTSAEPASAMSKVDQTPKPKNPVFCVGLGVRSVQCEDLETGEHRKYDLPESFGYISRMVPNKDGSKFFANVYLEQDGTSKTTEAFKVYDLKLHETARLPVSTNDSGSSDLQDVSWLDNDSIVYSKRKDGKKQIYVFDIASQKETLLLETDDTVERLMPSGDKTYIYAIQGLVNKTTNSVERKLIVINTNTKSLTDIGNGVVGIDGQDLAFDTTSSLFYANILLQKEQKFNIRTFKVDDVATQPKLSFVSQIDNARYVASYAYQMTVTSKGILAQPETDFAARAPIRFYTATGQYKTLTLGVGARNEYYLPLQEFPDFKKSSSSEPVTRDFFQPPAGTPQAITTFVDKMVDEKAGCKPGEYKTFELYKNDGDKQFSLNKQGCEEYGLVIYRQENGSYKEVTSIKEGMDCERRDSLGISAAVYPDCRKPGEGL
jgi:hypothetical protein